MTVKTSDSERDPFGGRMWGIWNVEGDSEPLALFPRKCDADATLARRQALPDEDEDRLTEYHQIFHCDVAGVWWNSYDPDPREDDPLSPVEILDWYSPSGTSARITVGCKFCHQQVPAETAHLHQGGWVGDECCWDERLRATE